MPRKLWWKELRRFYVCRHSLNHMAVGGIKEETKKKNMPLINQYVVTVVFLFRFVSDSFSHNPIMERS